MKYYLTVMHFIFTCLAIFCIGCAVGGIIIHPFTSEYIVPRIGAIFMVLLIHVVLTMGLTEIIKDLD